MSKLLALANEVDPSKVVAIIDGGAGAKAALIDLLLDPGRSPRAATNQMSVGESGIRIVNDSL